MRRVRSRPAIIKCQGRHGVQVGASGLVRCRTTATAALTSASVSRSTVACRIPPWPERFARGRVQAGVGDVGRIVVPQIGIDTVNTSTTVPCSGPGWEALSTGRDPSRRWRANVPSRWRMVGAQAPPLVRMSGGQLAVVHHVPDQLPADKIGAADDRDAWQVLERRVGEVVVGAELQHARIWVEPRDQRIAILHVDSVLSVSRAMSGSRLTLVPTCRVNSPGS